jgi:hypothetical protein
MKTERPQRAVKFMQHFKKTQNFDRFLISGLSNHAFSTAWTRL